MHLGQPVQRGRRADRTSSGTPGGNTFHAFEAIFHNLLSQQQSASRRPGWTDSYAGQDRQVPGQRDGPARTLLWADQETLQDLLRYVGLDTSSGQPVPITASASASSATGQYRSHLNQSPASRKLPHLLGIGGSSVTKDLAAGVQGVELLLPEGQLASLVEPVRKASFWPDAVPGRDVLGGQEHPVKAHPLQLRLGQRPRRNSVNCCAADGCGTKQVQDVDRLRL